MIPYRNEMTSSHQVDKKLCKDFVLTLLDFGTYFSKNADRKELKKSLRFLKLAMSLLGILPVTVNTATQDYEFHWHKFATFHCLATIAWLTILVVCSCVGLMGFIPVCSLDCDPDPVANPNENESGVLSLPSSGEQSQSIVYNSMRSKGLLFQAEEFMGILVVLGSVYNAWVQTLTVFYRRRPLASFLNKWVHDILTRDIDPLPGLFKIANVSCLLLFGLAFLLLMFCLVGKPDLLVGIVEAFSREILMVSDKWMQKSLLCRKVS